MKNKPFLRNPELGALAIGCCLALISQTTLRFFHKSIGPGEVGLGVIACVAVFRILMTGSLFRGADSGWLVSFFGFVIVILMPVTVVNVICDTPGASVRDLLAYLLCALCTLYWLHDDKFFDIARYFVFFLMAIISAQYFFGGDAVYYSYRFAAGARNPNQLALYMMCALLIIALLDRSLSWKVLFSLPLLYFGLLSFSDAFFLATASSAVVYIVFRLGMTKAAFLFPFFGVFCIVMIVYLPHVVGFLADEWRSADQGFIRLTLFENGMIAYVDTPFSIIFGHGAGYFSGREIPFGRFEAHNTVIDMLTVGGIVGLFLVYGPIMYVAWNFYKIKKYYIVSLIAGLMIYSLFHFVARHPVFWFSVVAMVMSCSNYCARFSSESKCSWP